MNMIITPDNAQQGPRGYTGQTGPQGIPGNQGNQGNQGDPGEGTSMPWWVRAISIFGVPAAIAMYLVWSLAGTQAKALNTINDNQLRHNLEMNQGWEANKESQYRMESYLRILCVQAAKTKAEQNTCLSVR